MHQIHSLRLPDLCAFVEALEVTAYVGVTRTLPFSEPPSPSDHICFGFDSVDKFDAMGCGCSESLLEHARRILRGFSNDIPWRFSSSRALELTTEPTSSPQYASLLDILATLLEVRVPLLRIYTLSYCCVGPMHMLRVRRMFQPI
jgi:hypothetical protein